MNKINIQTAQKSHHSSLQQRHVYHNLPCLQLLTVVEYYEHYSFSSANITKNNAYHLNAQKVTISDTPYHLMAITRKQQQVDFFGSGNLYMNMAH
jgi:hypothetical protein